MSPPPAPTAQLCDAHRAGTRGAGWPSPDTCRGWPGAAGMVTGSRQQAQGQQRHSDGLCWGCKSRVSAPPACTRALEIRQRQLSKQEREHHLRHGHVGLGVAGPVCVQGAGRREGGRSSSMRPTAWWTQMHEIADSLNATVIPLKKKLTGILRPSRPPGGGGGRPCRACLACPACRWGGSVQGQHTGTSGPNRRPPA